jgi:hypothetical protein
MSRRDFEEIWEFFSRFVDRSPEEFMAKLAKTDEIGCARDENGKILAFWALAYVDVHRDGVHHRVLYSVWAGVDPSVRNTGITRLAGFGALVRQRLRYPAAKLYWFFTASTVNSYRFMANTLPEYYPRPDKRIPAELKALCDATAAQLGGDNWDLERGVLVRNHDVLYREGVVRPGLGRLDPVAEVYAQLNPHQSRGDSLLCICPLHAENMRALIARIARHFKPGQSQQRPAGMRDIAREIRRASTIPPSPSYS